VQIPDVPPQLLAALVEAAAGQRLALVGGVVRDLLLHRHHQDPWRGLPDLDLVVEGQAADLVARLPAALEHQFATAIPLRQQPHGRYGTVELKLQLPQCLGGSWLVDLASARREVYATPASNPMVSPGTLEQDLERRDFTVNAMALELVHGGLVEGQLLDPHGGQSDLAARQLRFLHPQSLSDDPTRMLRAARYAARLGMELAPEASERIQSVLKRWPWTWRLGDAPEDAPPALASRLRMELELLLEREPWSQGLHQLQHWGVLGLLDPRLQSDDQWRRRLHWAKRLELPLLPCLVANAKDPLGLASRLQLPHRHQTWLRQMVGLQTKLTREAWPTGAATWCDWLEAPGVSVEAVALTIVAGNPAPPQLSHWLFRWRFVQPSVSASDLIRMGWEPGPSLGKELKKQRMLNLEPYQ